MRPMRLAVFGGVSPDNGSSASAHFLLLESLLRRGHSIDFFAIYQYGIPWELTKYPGFRVIEVRLAGPDRVLHLLLTSPPPPLAFVLSRAFNFYREACYARRIGERIWAAHRSAPYDLLLVVDRLSAFPRRPDLPCVSWPQGCPESELEAVRRLRKQVIRFCGYPFYVGFWWYYRWLIRLTRRQVSRSHILLCPSRFTKEYWLRFGGRPGEVVILPYPVDLDRFRPDPAVAAPPRPFRFLHVGRIVPRKRLDLLLEAFQLLRRDDPAVELALAGDLAMAGGYRRLLEEPRLMAGVRFLGRVERSGVPDLLRSSGAFVQTSENENFGTAVMEALACGVPVIVGPSNGTKDYVPPRSVVFDSYTPESVCSALKVMKAACLADGPAVRAEARRAAETHFAVDVVTDRLLAVCQSVVRGGSRRTRSSRV